MTTTHPDPAAMAGAPGWDVSALRREAARLAALPRTREPTIGEVLADEARATLADEREPFDPGHDEAPVVVETAENPAGRSGRTPSIRDLDAVLAEITTLESRVAVLHGRRTELIAQAGRLAEVLEADLLDDTDPIARVAPSSRRRELAHRAVVADLATALHVGETAAETLTEHAQTLTTRAPATLAALHAGELSWAHATQIAKHVADLSPTEAREVERIVLAGGTDCTAPQLGDRARKIRELFHPVPLDVRHADAATHRAVWLDRGRDGMAWLTAHLPAPLAHAAYDRLTRTADLLRDTNTAGPVDPIDARTPDQRRADVLAALLLDDGTLDLTATTNHDATTDDGATGHDAATGQRHRAGTHRPVSDRPAEPGEPDGPDEQPHGPGRQTDHPDDPPIDPLLELLCRQRHLATLARSVRPRLNITVPVLTLLGQSETPGTLDGHVPIDPQTARLLAALAPSFRRILTDPETGTVLSAGRATYTVPADLKALLEQRDLTCRFPGCRRPAHRTDLDHTIAWADGGTTAADNLAHLCRRQYA
ncbi:hypothetical protein GCM10009809_08140 [Isoptericola hypogeus]|uniref:HNH nuclease domain-containing protein n=1 Tax=Isoptericola hypogeus TaxID=300179 RepID=A0ABP4UYB4_9MICO